MKNITLIIALCFALIGCKNEVSKDVNLEENRSKSYNTNDGFVTIKGEFLYDEKNKAAIIQKSDNTIYSVVVNDAMHKLNAETKPFKKDIYDMVAVTVRVKKSKNTIPNSVWQFQVEIKEILKVEASNQDAEAIIKIGK